jgi:dienelactone hydrolase
LFIKLILKISLEVDGMSEVLKDIINALRNGTVPAEGTEYIAVGIDDELKEIESQLEYVRKDKSAFKFIIGDYGSGKTFFSTAVREMAFSKNFVVSSVVISSEAPLHNFEELYRKIMGGLRVADNKKIPAFSVILEEWLLDLEDKVSAIEGISPEDNEEEFKKAMWIIRENADKWNLDPEKIAVCGFSAGGHLAASLGVFWNELYISEAIGMPEGINKPNGLILGYPVITSGKYAHRGSFSNLLGRDATAEQKEGMSLELHVKNQVPPTFLWHTFHDLAVPVENSLLFAQALRQSGIPFELHIFPDGPHGLSLCDEETAVNNPDLINPHAANWMPLCIEWLKELFSS